MGLFDSFKEYNQLNNLEKVRNTAQKHGLTKGTHSENCERCEHVIRGKCATGLACSGRQYSDGTYLVVPANYVCEHFSR